MARLSMEEILARARDSLAGRPGAKPGAKVVQLTPTSQAQGFEEMMASALPRPTEWERSVDDSLKRDYPTPYKQGMPKVERLSTVTHDPQGKKLRSPEKQAYHEAWAKTVRGQRLTHADKAVLAKHRMAVIMAQLKAKAKSRSDET